MDVRQKAVAKNVERYQIKRFKQKDCVHVQWWSPDKRYQFPNRL